MPSFKKFGQMLIKALTKFARPVTLDHLISYVSEQSGLAEDEIRRNLKHVLKRGLFYGFIEQVAPKFYLTKELQHTAPKRKTTKRKTIKKEFEECSVQRPEQLQPARTAKNKKTRLASSTSIRLPKRNATKREAKKRA